MGIARHLRMFGAAAVGMIALTTSSQAQWQEFNPGSQADQIYRTGNVAIGTSGTPLAKLDLGGDLSMNASRIALRGASFTSDFLRFNGTAFGLTNVNQWNYSGNIVFAQGTSNRATMTLTSDGNMLLGKMTGTPLPTQRLELASGNLMLTNGSGSTDGNIYLGGQPEFGNNGMRLYAGLVNGMDQSGYIDVRSGVSGDGLRFRVDNTTGSTERMRITAGGNIGIGTTTPMSSLQIGNRLTLQDNINKAIGYNTYYSNGDKRIADDEAANIGFTDAGDIFLRTAANNFRGTDIAWTNALYVKNNGRVGIGMNNPSYQLDVMGAENGGNFVATSRGVNGVVNGGSSVGMKVGVWGSASGTGNGSVYGVYGTTSGAASGVGYAAVYANGNLTYTGTLSQTSDARLKENVKTMEGALAKVMKLRPTTYSYKASGDMNGMNLATGTQFGFIAQEVEQVLPELVTKNVHINPADPGAAGVEYKGVNYVGVIPVVTQAVREQQGTIVAQGADITALKNDVADIRTDVAGLAAADADLAERIDGVSSETSDVKRQVNELAGENADLRKQVSDLTALIGEMKGRLDSLVEAGKTSGIANPNGSAPISMLSQNTPNPFAEETTVNYVVPSTTRQAELVITDATGAEIERVGLAGRGEGSVRLVLKNLRAGSYVYSLVADGAVLASEKMVVVK